MKTFLLKINYLGLGILIAVSSIIFIVAPTTNAQECSIDTTFYEGNDILYYNPCAEDAAATSACSATGSLTDPAPTELTGASNAEKVWNYFIQRGLSPVGAAGAMGNIEQESGFNPWIGESGSTSIDPRKMLSGFGLIQWTNTDGNSQGRRYGVMTYLSENGINLASVNTNDQKQTDTALLYELNYLWDVEYNRMTWQEPVNAEKTVDGDPSIPYSADNIGNGSTLMFHKLVERSGDDTEGKQERIDSALNFLKQFGGEGMDCSISEGGLTYEQAKIFMMNYGTNKNGWVQKQVESSGASWKLRGCKGGGGSNCVTFSEFFVNGFTDLSNDSLPDGRGVVADLASNGAKTGTVPRVWSIFSWSNDGYGHTGVVLGIQGDEIIVGHASCSFTGSGTGDGTYEGGGSGFVFKSKIDSNEAFWYHTPSGFAYPENVNTEAIQEFLDKGYVN